MSDALRDLYQQVIVKASRDTSRRGTLAQPTHTATVDNPMCGDVVMVQLAVDGPTIRDARYQAQGCALSLASASLLVERIVGSYLSDLRTLDEVFREVLAGVPGDPIPEELGDLAAFAGVREFRSRRACATLPFDAVLSALRTLG
jgi:nitrogen fixation protein NifU and related proteins